MRLVSVCFLLFFRVVLEDDGEVCSRGSEGWHLELHFAHQH